MVTCPDFDRCAIREHKGYTTCEAAGRCQLPSSAQRAMLAMRLSSLADQRRRQEEYQAELARQAQDRQAKNLLFLICLLAFLWAILFASIKGWIVWPGAGP